MEKDIVNAGKKVAQDLAPNPIEHTPEAPIISEEEAQIIESPSGATSEPRIDEGIPEDIRRQAGNSGTESDDGLRITPDD